MSGFTSSDFKFSNPVILRMQWLRHSHRFRARQRMVNVDRLSRATGPLIRLLRQLSIVVGKLTDSQYTQKPVGVVESSVGGHVRHCLDHVRSLLLAVEPGISITTSAAGVRRLKHRVAAQWPKSTSLFRSFGRCRGI